MPDTDWRLPCFEHLPKARPVHASALAATVEPFEQQLAYAVKIRFQAAAIAADTEVRDVSL